MPICAEAREIAEEIYDALVAVLPAGATEGCCDQPAPSAATVGVAPAGSTEGENPYDDLGDDCCAGCDMVEPLDVDDLRQQLASQLQRSTTPLVSEVGYYLLNYLV